MMEKIKEFVNSQEAVAGGDMIGKIIGVTFGVYVVAYALTTALLALVNTTGFAATSAVSPILLTLLPIIVTIGVAWMFYKHMSTK